MESENHCLSHKGPALALVHSRSVFPKLFCLQTHFAFEK
jgi:hypothetical protein